MCRSKPRTGKTTGIPVQQIEDDLSDDGVEESLFVIKSGGSAPLQQVKINIDGQPLMMEVDTGASWSLVSEMTCWRHWPRAKLQRSNMKLCMYSSEPIPVKGSMIVCVKYRGQIASLPLLIVEGGGPSILGRSWLKAIKLDWQQIYWVRHSTLEGVLQGYRSVFSKELGLCKNVEARIHIDPRAKPRYCKAQSVPYYVLQRVETEL